MMIPATTRNTVAILAAATLSAAAVAVPAIAGAQAMPSGSVRNWAPRRPANQAFDPSNRFILNGHQDVELMRFTKSHDVEVCVPRMERMRSDANRKPTLQQYPVSVRWDKDTGEVWPGNCLSFDAQKVKVRPAPGTPAGAHIEGRYRVY